MKLLFISAFALCAIVPLFAEAAWFSRDHDAHKNYTTIPYEEDRTFTNRSTLVSDIEAQHVRAGAEVLPRREHVQRGPDHVTIHKEIPIQTKIVEIPMIRTAVVTATVTATATNVVTAIETVVATETATVTDVKTVHAVHTVLPSVDNYRLSPNEQPKQISEDDELVYRRCFDITVPKTNVTEQGVTIHKYGKHFDNKLLSAGEVKQRNSAMSTKTSAIVALVVTFTITSFII